MDWWFTCCVCNCAFSVAYAQYHVDCYLLIAAFRYVITMHHWQVKFLLPIFRLHRLLQLLQSPDPQRRIHTVSQKKNWTLLCNHIHFFTETAEYIWNACGNFIVVTKQKILVIPLTVLFHAASRHHNDVILTSFIVYLFTVTVCLF